MSRLNIDLVPGQSLGKFTLGMPISQAITLVQKLHTTISQAELKYEENSPLSSDLMIDLIEQGILLRFEPHSQRLRCIEVYSVDKICISYSGSIFCSPELAPTFALIYSRFGPSYPGDFDHNRHIYYLNYPGLSFTFLIPPDFKANYLNANEVPVEFPDGTTPIVSRIIIYYGLSLRQINVPPLAPTSFYFEEVEVKISEYILFKKRQVKLDFRSSTQDVVSLLGPPDSVFYKEEDKMKIHSSNYTGTGCADYFYNYFTLGVDILFDIRSHLVKKLILHTNFPSHVHFNRYVKCNFRIQTPDGTSVITPDMRWEKIQTFFESVPKPVIYNSGSKDNPFGALHFYGYNNIIFEVMKNGHLASVCLFKKET